MKKPVPNYKHPLYGTWANLRRRCFNPEAKDFANYGGRGVAVCQRWAESFEAFVEDVDKLLGPKPDPSYSLDRVNNDGNYEPSNVRWATKREQTLNRRPVSTQGEQNGNSKLTEDKVRKLRKLLKQGKKPTELASLFGVSLGAVYGVKDGRTWAWLT